MLLYIARLVSRRFGNANIQKLFIIAILFIIFFFLHKIINVLTNRHCLFLVGFASGFCVRTADFAFRVRIFS